MKQNTHAATEQQEEKPQTDQSHLDQPAAKVKTFEVKKEINVDGKNYLPGNRITLSDQNTIDSLKQSKYIK